MKLKILGVLYVKTAYFKKLGWIFFFSLFSDVLQKKNIGNNQQINQ